MNSLDKKYIVGTIIVGLILLSLEITAYSVDDNYSSFVFYEERKIITELEFSSSKINENDSKIMHIKIFDETSNEKTRNTTFFMTITHDDVDILRKYFFVNNEELTINISSDPVGKVKVFGTQQYEFDAYVMSDSSPVEIVGPFLIPEEEYTIKIKLKTIDNIGNIVSKLEPFEFYIETDKLTWNNSANLSSVDKNDNIPSVNFLEFEKNQNANLNNYGFRGPDIDPANSKKLNRIILVGGSTMYGAGATSDETTIAGNLQQIINNSLPLNNFEVINAGIQGINSYAEITVIEDIIELNPSIVIVLDGWNDLQDDHDPISIYNNWKKMCEIGINHNFNTIINLQPIAGFADKNLSEKEKHYSVSAVDKTGTKLISKISNYNNYGKNLAKITDKCVAEDLRNIFDDVEQEVYLDEGHLNDYGNFLVAEKIFSLHSSYFISNINNVTIHNKNIDENIVFPLSFQELISYYKTPNFIKQIITNMLS